MTTEEAYNDFLVNLGQLYERREAGNIADWVFEHVTGLKRLERRIHNTDKLNKTAEMLIRKYLSELLQSRPVQYVLQEAWFYKMRFFVNSHVLIPRPETEELVSWIVQYVRNTKSDARSTEFRLLDIGTGSGCIAISLKKELSYSHITAIDVSENALLVAKKNSEALQAPVELLRIDFLDESRWDIFKDYDIIVSNPPYIPEMEKKKLAKNVAAFEPGIALFVQNDDPFIFYEKIAKFGQSHLKPGGQVFVEMHEDYWRETTQIFNGYDFKTDIREDMYGKERMLKAVQV